MTKPSILYSTDAGSCHSFAAMAISEMAIAESESEADASRIIQDFICF